MARTLKVDGTEYELPGIDTLNMDEHIILYEYAQIGMDQIAELEGLHPGVLAGLIHVGVARARPEAKKSEIRDVVGKLNLFDVINQLEPGEGEARPTVLKSVESSESSGPDSSSTGDASPDSSEAASSGDQTSDTGATSPPTAWAG
jgi:hypothetical protein